MSRRLLAGGLLAVATAVAALATAPPAPAATDSSWSGLSTSSNLWSDAANWGGTAPGTSIGNLDDGYVQANDLENSAITVSGRGELQLDQFTGSPEKLPAVTLNDASGQESALAVDTAHATETGPDHRCPQVQAVAAATAPVAYEGRPAGRPSA